MMPGFGKTFRTLCLLLILAAPGLAASPSVSTTADTIFRGGPIVTVDRRQPEVAALAVAGGVIIAVGDEDSVMKTRGPATKVVDLAGKALMPGFVEPHTHVIGTAFDTHLLVDLSSFTVPMKPGTIPQTIQTLRRALKQVPQGGWLTAFGVDPSRTTPFMKSLTAEMLDKVSTTVPIFVLNQSGHVAYVNHKAFELAGITNSTPNPPGGVYVKQYGKLTGELDEPPAYVAFQKKIAQPPPSMVLQALHETYSSFAAAGVTTATELCLGAVTGSVSKELALLQLLAADPNTPLRVRAYLYNAVVPAPFTMKPNEGNDQLRVIGIKFFADGSTQGLTAALKEAYGYPRDTKNKGALDNPTTAGFVNAAKRFADDGWQLATHSNGDAATRQVLDVYGHLLAGDRNPAARRWRIEHLTVTEEDQLDRVKELGLTVSMTIGHVYYWGYAFDKHNILGPSRARRIDPAASLLARGVRFSFHSDSPVTRVAPLRYISTAVTRLWQVEPQQVLGADQRISVDDAIRAVTLDAAYQLFLDDKVGSLEVGKWADLVILDRNPRTTKPEEIMNIKVHSTYLSGVRKYKPKD